MSVINLRSKNKGYQQFNKSNTTNAIIFPKLLLRVITTVITKLSKSDFVVKRAAMTHPKRVGLSRFMTKAFVRGTNEAEDRRERDNVKSQNALNGLDVQEFYNEVVSEESQAANRDKELKLKKNFHEESASSALPKLPKPRPKDLFVAAECNDAEGVRKCIEQGVDPDARDLYSWTPLMTSACAGAFEATEALLDAGADTSAADRSGNTCMRLAAKNGHRGVSVLIRNHRAVRVEEPKSNGESDGRDEPQSWYCEECRITLKESTYEEHLSSTAHQISVGTSKAPSLYGIPETNRGFRMMLGAGWDREGGLGTEGNRGRKFPVKTVLKRDRLGVGAEGTRPARVTHFRANDPASVAGPRNAARSEREATLNKRKREALVRKCKLKEIGYSRELGGL